MPANIPDLGAISNLGGQFTTNVFATGQKKLAEGTKKKVAQRAAQARQTAANRERFAQSAVKTINQGRTQFARSQKTTQPAPTSVKSGSTTPTSSAPKQTQPAATAIPAAKPSAPKASKTAVPSTLSTQFPAQKAAPKGSGSHEFYNQEQDTGWTSQVGKFKMTGYSTPDAPLAGNTPVKPKSIPAASFSSQLAPQKPVAKPQGSTTASFSSPGGTVKPAIPSAPKMPVTGPQFSSAPERSSFPQHSHPTGSSKAELPTLTANQPKPNTFTVGSRNAKPGGIAARGSQLEAWAIGRQQEFRKNKPPGE